MLSRAICFLVIFAFCAVSAPLSSAGAQEYESREFAGTAADFLNPDKLFEALKKNITIPIPGAASTAEKIEVPTPGQALEKASPKLQEVNQEVREETGIDLAKFIGWFAKILKVFFLTVVDLLEMVSQALQKN